LFLTRSDFCFAYQIFVSIDGPEALTCDSSLFVGIPVIAAGPRR